MNQSTSCDPQGDCGGRIYLIYFNETVYESFVIGVATFKTKADMDASWASIPALPPSGGDTWCCADYRTPNGDIMQNKQVSQETCSALMGKPFSELIVDGIAWNETGKPVILSKFFA